MLQSTAAVLQGRAISGKGSPPLPCTVLPCNALQGCCTALPCKSTALPFPVQVVPGQGRAGQGSTLAKRAGQGSTIAGQGRAGQDSTLAGQGRARQGSTLAGQGSGQQSCTWLHRHRNMDSTQARHSGNIVRPCRHTRFAWHSVIEMSSISLLRMAEAGYGTSSAAHKYCCSKMPQSNRYQSEMLTQGGLSAVCA